MLVRWRTGVQQGCPGRNRAIRSSHTHTGEGKTIVALLPTFLAALEDKGGVFVVTPNDYLARRDAENVGQVLRFLGVTVGLVQSTMEVPWCGG